MEEEGPTGHARRILAAIVPDRQDLLDVALKHLTVDHFTDPQLRNVFVMLDKYYNVTGQVLKKQAMVDLLVQGKQDPGRIALYQETFEFLEELHVVDADFRWSLDRIKEIAAERRTAEVLAEAMEVLTKGVTDAKGVLHQGHEDARKAVLNGLALIDRTLAMQDAPEGIIQFEADEMLADYVARKRARMSGAPMGVYFGVPVLDAKIGGLQNGDLDVVAGFTSSGKTALCIQLAWHAAVMQGINVVYLTTETLRPQVRRKMLSRHSVMDLFGLSEGLNSKDLRDGTLSEHEEAVLQDVIHDFAKNPNYGRTNIIQLPKNATVGTAEARAMAAGRDMEVGLVVLDYAFLLKPSRNHQSTREGLVEVLQDSKQTATTFYDGRGVPIVTPWQTGRAKWERAQEVGAYGSDATADTAESINIADILVALLEQKDRQRRSTLKGQVLKNRDGETGNSLEISVDYATCNFSSSSSTSSMGSLLDVGLFG